MNNHFNFLSQEFFEAHPKYLKNDFYVTGESYAGHYIPAVAGRIHRGNKEYQGVHINLKVQKKKGFSQNFNVSRLIMRFSRSFLKGFAIGNGLTNPQIQYKAYPDYALEMGIIKKPEFDRIMKVVPTCELASRFCGSAIFHHRFTLK